MSILNNTTVLGVVTQTQPAVSDDELVRLGEARTLLQTLFQGDWDDATNFSTGQIVKDDGALWLAKVDNLNKKPATNPTQWSLLMEPGAAGAAAFVYLGYADASDGTGFTLTFNSSKDYIAIKATSSPIAGPVVGDFAGLWKKYQGGTSAVTSVNSLTGAVVLTTATVTENTNLYYTDTRVRACVLTGLSTGPGGSIGTGDSVLSAFGKTQNRLAALETAMPSLSGTSPITYASGVIGINAASAATVNYVVQRDANGDFSARKITLGSLTAADLLKLGSAQVGWDGTSVTFNTPVATATVNLGPSGYQFLSASSGVQLYTGTDYVFQTDAEVLVVTSLRLDSQSGILVADVSGNVTGTADTDDLPEGGTNLYYTAARANAAADARITLQKAAANGLASLDGSGKLTTAQIPASLVGAVSFQATWNANTNNPALASGTGTKGFYYVVATAGATSLDGITDWKIGDWVIFNGTVWQKVDNTDSVTSVNTLTGAVVLTTAEITEGANLYYTDTRVRACVLTGLNTASGAAISATDTVLVALGKTQNRLAAIEAWTTANLTENTNLYYTDTRVRACVLTGLSAASGGTVASSDTLLVAIGKIENRLALDDAKVTGSDRALKAGDTFTGPVVHAPTAASSGSPAILTLTGAGHTTLTASTECMDVYLNLNRVVQFSTGALTTQRAIDIAPPKYAFVAASTLTHAVTLSIEGAPIGWTNATITNAYAAKIAGGALSGTTNGFGLYIDAPTGATNNYGLVVASGNVGIGTAAPSGLLDVNDDHIRVRTAKTPATAGATGNAGDICWDAGFLYVCVATNSWKRVAIASW